MKIKMSADERGVAVKELRSVLDKAGRVVFVNCRSVAASGMSRKLGFSAFIGNGRGKPVSHIWLSYRVAALLGEPFDEDSECVVVRGCGMDMGFACVYHLGSVLYPGGDGRTVTGRNGDKNPETDGGYLLRHEWI